MVNFGPFQSYLFLNYQPHCRQLCTCFWSGLHTKTWLWEPWWAKRILSSKYQGSLLCSLIAAFDHKGEGTEVSSRCCCTAPLPSDFQGELMGQHLFSFPSFFFSFPFRSQTLETRILKNNYMYRENWKVTAYAQQKVQKRPEKNLS